jgi:hypothetical protein
MKAEAITLFIFIFTIIVLDKGGMATVYLRPFKKS